MKGILVRKMQVIVALLFVSALLLPMTGSTGKGWELAGEAIFATGAAHASQAAPQSPMVTMFTYQGELQLNGAPVNIPCDFQFGLWDADSGGNPVGGTLDRLGTLVENGKFNALLDFGLPAFAGEARWLEVAVRCPAGSGTYTKLDRQPITATPYAIYAMNAGMLGGQPADTFQQRVNGICAVGSTIRAIDPSGFPICQADAPLNRSQPPQVNSISTIATDVGSSQHTSITIGTDGMGLIVFDDDAHDSLKVAHCNNPTCTSATVSTLDGNPPDVGYYPSVAIGQDGLGIISYYDQDYDVLKIAHCEELECSSATIYSFSGTLGGGEESSITIGADGLPLIAYYDDDLGDLIVLHCDNPSCSYTATLANLDSTNIVGREPSIALGADGLGITSYYDATNGRLKVAHCSNQECLAATITTVDTSYEAGWFSSITIGFDGLGLIAYTDAFNHDLKVAHCSNTQCSSSTYNTIDSSGFVGSMPSITIGADGLGLITYYDESNMQLKAAHCQDVTCTAAIVFALDNTAATVGIGSAVTIGTDGYGLVSYYDSTNSAIKVVHCTSVLGMTMFRRR